MVGKFPGLGRLVSWAVEREAIRGRRASGAPPPWSEDPLLATYRFCNADVQHDLVSRVIFDTITEPFAGEPGLIVALTVCRFTNAPEVIEAVRNHLVPFDAERFVAIMEDRKARGLPLERRAYVIPGGQPGELKAKSLTRDLFIPLAGRAYAISPCPGDLCQAVFERLQELPYLNAGFISAQVIRDLKQVEPLRSASDWHSFVRSGPGSQRGLNRIMGAKVEAEIDRVRTEPEWRELFEELVTLAAPQVDFELDAQSWQNVLCETDKYFRFSSGDLKGARRFSPQSKKPAPRSKPEPTPIEPTPHALPELAAARDPAGAHVLFHDLETRSAVDLKASGAWKYAASPTTEVLVLCYAVDDEPVQFWTPGDPLPSEFTEAASNPNWLLVAHNDAFERAIATHILEPRHGLPSIPLERRRCSMAMAGAAALPMALEKAIEALGLPHPKDKAGAALMRRMSRPLPSGAWIEDAASLERLYQYCRHDVEAERALFNALPPLTEEEQQVWQLDAVINARGFAVDPALLDMAARVVAKAEAALQGEFREITGLNSTNQVDKLLRWLAAHDCEVSDLKKGTLAHALRRKRIAPEIRRAIEIRRQLAHASAAKIKALRSWRGEDDRVRGSLIFCGAATGRWIGRGVQPQNFKRDGEHIAEKIASVMAGGAGLESPVEAVGDIARAMIVGAAGHELLVGDFSGIESRILAWISGEASKLEEWRCFDETGAPADDPYYRIGKQCGLGEDIARNKGKLVDLAFGFGGGAGAWARIAPEDDPSTEADVQRFKQTWRNRHPRTTAFWYALDRAVKAAIRRPGEVFTVGRLAIEFEAPFLRIGLPSGRALAYPFAELRPDREGRSVVFFKDNAAGAFADCRHGFGAWFGMFVENVVQALARDVLVAAMVRLETVGLRVTLHVHDEIIVEAPEGASLEEFRQLMAEPPAWAPDLPIAVKARASPRFANEDAKAVDIEIAGVELGSADDGLDDNHRDHLGHGAADEVGADLKKSVDIDADDDEYEGEDEALFEEEAEESEDLPAWVTPTMGEVPPGPELDAILAGEAPASEEPEPGPEPSPREAPRGGAPRGNGHAHEATDDPGPNRRFNGNYGERESEWQAGKAYGPIKSRLLQQGYRVTQSFSFMLPGNGDPLYYEDRYELPEGSTPTKDRPRKQSRYRHCVNGKELSDTGPRRIVYNWPAIFAAGHGATVFITEGANKSKPLNDAGLRATAAPYHQWSAECVQALAGAHLIYLEDHNPIGGDDPAQKYSANAQAKLGPVAASYRTVPALHLWKRLGLGGEPRQGWDVIDWIAAGGKLAELEEICREIPAELDEIKVLTKAEFLRGFLPPDYLIDGVLQRRYIYSLTGQTGHAKTAIALRLAQLVDCGGMLDGHEVTRGRVAYLVGENPDDVRIRVIGDDAILGDSGNNDIIFVPGVFDTDALLRKVESLGELDLIIIDTSAAYFLGDDENSNPQLGEHARKLRKLIGLPGGPCGLVLCHPIKHAAEPAHLLPRGGGAFLAEVDGNLTAWRDNKLITMHHSDKFRGPGFEPIIFRLETVIVDALHDSKGRPIPTVRAVTISETEEEQEASAARAEENEVLLARLDGGQAMSIAQLARALGWFFADGRPYKSKVHRALNRLKAAGMMKSSRGDWDLTDKGEKAARELKKGASGAY